MLLSVVSRFMIALVALLIGTASVWFCLPKAMANPVLNDIALVTDNTEGKETVRVVLKGNGNFRYRIQFEDDGRAAVVLPNTSLAQGQLHALDKTNAFSASATPAGDGVKVLLSNIPMGQYGIVVDQPVAVLTAAPTSVYHPEKQQPILQPKKPAVKLKRKSYLVTKPIAPVAIKPAKSVSEQDRLVINPERVLKAQKTIEPAPEPLTKPVQTLEPEALPPVAEMAVETPPEALPETKTLKTENPYSEEDKKAELLAHTLQAPAGNSGMMAFWLVLSMGFGVVLLLAVGLLARMAWVYKQAKKYPQKTDVKPVQNTAKKSFGIGLPTIYPHNIRMAESAKTETVHQVYPELKPVTRPTTAATMAKLSTATLPALRWPTVRNSPFQSAQQPPRFFSAMNDAQNISIQPPKASQYLLACKNM